MTFSLVLRLRFQRPAIYGPQELEAASRSLCLIDTNLPKGLIPLFCFSRLTLLASTKTLHMGFVISFFPAKSTKKKRRNKKKKAYQSLLLSDLPKLL